jgi:GNAT superfamily N-acetyltransferase
MNDDIVLVEQFPGVDDYLLIRAAAGMHAKSREAAARALPNTLHGVRLEREGAIVGMGRVIGDNGCFFTIVDIAVVPEMQGRGLGKRIMSALDAWLQRNVPPTAYVTLVADGDAKHLYAQFGFVESAPIAVNMEYVMEAGGRRSIEHLRPRDAH